MDNKYIDFIEDFKITGSITKSRKKFKVSHDKAVVVLSEFGLKQKSRQEAAASLRILSLEEAQKRLPNQEDKIIGFENSKYKIIAKDGFIYYKSSAKIRQGDPRGKSGCLSDINKISNQLVSIGYVLDKSTFTRKRDSVQATCLKCNKIRKNRFSNFFIQQCPYCSAKGSSKGEEEVKAWVESFGFVTEKFKFKGKTKKKEIDVYIPTLKVGIEYCGLYWHSVANRKDINCHFDKMKQAQDQGIRLITIFEDEWQERQAQVKNFLKSALHVHTRKIHARKCEIRQVSKEETFMFLNNNHIQGKSMFEVSIGLYNNNELVGLVTGNKHHRQKHIPNHTFVLNRLAFKDGISVSGGSSKLLKQLIKYAKDNRYEQLISWSDNRWSEGAVYVKTGFKLDEELASDYSYTDGFDRLSKQSCSKKLLLKRGAVGSMENKEYELAETLGLSRIYDCGKKRWSLNL